MERLEACSDVSKAAATLTVKSDKSKCNGDSTVMKKGLSQSMTRV